jgi:DNA-binding GntR family transcriptional regulator
LDDVLRKDSWSFLPGLISVESYNLAFRFRMTVEPAALLEPTYRIDRTAFVRCRALQQGLVDGAIRELSSAELFQLGSSFHETIVGCAQNPFFLEAMQRLNRLRRLIEYRAMVDTSHFIDQAREHLEILDRLEDGDRAGAAELLRRHLDVVRVVKCRFLDGPRAKNRATSSSKRVRRTGEITASVHF